MDQTITIRLDRDPDAALSERAKVAGKTRSALARELLAQELAETPRLIREMHSFTSS